MPLSLATRVMRERGLDGARHTLALFQPTHKHQHGLGRTLTRRREKSVDFKPIEEHLALDTRSSTNGGGRRFADRHGHVNARSQSLQKWPRVLKRGTVTASMKRGHGTALMSPEGGPPEKRSKGFMKVHDIRSKAVDGRTRSR